MVSPLRTSWVFAVHSSSEYLRNHWLSIILTTQSSPHLQITGLSAKSYMMVAMFLAIISALNSSLATDTFLPPYSGICSLIIPFLCSILYNSLVASWSLGSFWSLMPNFSIISAAGISPYPFTLHTLIGFTSSIMSSKWYLAINSLLFFKSWRAM